MTNYAHAPSVINPSAFTQGSSASVITQQQRQHELRMKVLNSRLRRGVADTEVCQGFTTDEVKVAIHNINLIKKAGKHKIHPRFQRHLGPVFIFLLTSTFNKSMAATNVPQQWRVPDTKSIRKGPRDDGELYTYIPHVDSRKNDGAPGHQPSKIFFRIAAPANRTPSRILTWSWQRGPSAPIVSIHN